MILAYGKSPDEYKIQRMKGEKIIFLIFYLMVIADNVLALHDLVLSPIYSAKIVALILLRLLIVACFISLILRNILLRKD